MVAMKSLLAKGKSGMDIKLWKTGKLVRKGFSEIQKLLAK